MDDDFERRRELRRQKREEMRLEAERMAFQGSNEDEEEAARERRRRARQERMRGMGGEEPSDSVVMTNSHSVTETVSVSSSMTSSGGGDDDEQALLERMAKREERRQKRLMEALEREKDQNPGNDGNHGSGENTVEERSVDRRGRYQDNEEEAEERNCRKEEEGEAAPEEEEEAEQGEGEVEEEAVEEEKPRRSYMREQESIEEKTRNEEDTEEPAVVLNEVEESVNSEVEVEEDAELSDKVEEEVEEPDQLEVEGTTVTLNNETEEDCGMSTIQNGLDVVNEKQNGGLHEETPQKHKKTERTLSHGSVRSPEAGAEEQDDTARLEAELKLQELKRRRDDAESEEFERMRQKQQEAEQELEELKKKREERRKIIEEEERQKKQEEAEKKAREEEEKRRMKEEIERRRAEAAEKRQQMGVETVDAEAKPFKCFSPRGSSLKIGERAEFLSKSAQKSTVKTTHSPVVSKIDNRLEQYTSVAQNKDMRSPRSGAVDLPMVTDGIRNIKSMWEKGSVFNSPGGGGGTYKEAAGMKIGVAGRINDWLNKTPESKTPGGRPADLKPGDVTNKRSLWENKGSSPAKVTGRGENKSVSNGMGHE
ncbi:non-muscle caldesmon isoform X1 [Salmo salar]|uniref:Non-muscle caldesmon-like isoform X1 n=1 Tax=Salmo salar TaxID=8030 RepID=A0ABM3F3P2_SALSA|nr:non-muscle caldesmon-like isoform X1 [Salmo salar]XP_045577901.1 non-muscle caldesmon-like isoform X1 [Salmo salar]XP_045577903.1 non-muscle caldesmon-like isoform X1 [Salmo salar]XP_045577904.1 non-muscle caldesmon-like isoform X1 [Salmo salar]XP_045577905.1 non-muscle caldesmon-like isoform X1 [Salmo salar]XP_045577906.1 non-muscle caldesmon-like isoform X1 [Salmo salar]